MNMNDIENLKKMFEAWPAATSAGMKIVSLEKGSIVVSAPINEKILTFHKDKVAAGGDIAAVAKKAGVFAVLTLLDETEDAVLVETTEEKYVQSLIPEEEFYFVEAHALPLVTLITDEKGRSHKLIEVHAKIINAYEDLKADIGMVYMAYPSAVRHQQIKKLREKVLARKAALN